MKIITINLPVSYINAINKKVGKNALYPSRSELIRVAVRDFLIRELQAAKEFADHYESNNVLNDVASKSILKPEINNNLFVQVPFGSNAEGMPEFKTFRLIKK